MAPYVIREAFEHLLGRGFSYLTAFHLLAADVAHHTGMIESAARQHVMDRLSTANRELV